MKVSELAKLLEGLALALADLAKQPALQGLTTFQTALQPFADETIEQFTAFLRQSEEYRRTGIISTGKKAPAKPKAGSMTVPDASAKVRMLLDEIKEGKVTSGRIDGLIADFSKGLSAPQFQELLTAVNISGKSKSKGQSADKLKQVLSSQLEMHIKSQAFGGQ